MIYRSRKRWGESPQRRRKQGFYAVVKPRNEAEKRAALQAALDEIETKYGADAVKGGAMFKHVVGVIVMLVGLFMLAAFVGTYLGMTLAARLWG